MTLHVASFGGGIVLDGSADSQRTDEVQAADSLDIGLRGPLFTTTDVADYLVLLDQPGNPWVRLWGLFRASGFNFSKIIAVGEGDAGAGQRYIMTSFNAELEVSPYPWASGGSQFGGAPLPLPTGNPVLVTGASFAGIFAWRFGGAGATVQAPVYFINIGAREGTAPRTAPGLYMLSVVPPAVIPFANQIRRFDSLGTGDSGLLDVPITFRGGEGAAVLGGGTNGKQLYFRGIIAYNNHLFGWGFDENDATNGDGPARVMFSNLGNPLKWGNDNIAATGTDRAFTDSDAVNLGDAGELIRGAIVWEGKLYFGTDRGLHYIAGYGRDSFITDGSTPVMRAFNTLGPHTMIEGPDKLLYGVCDQGLWVFNGAGAPLPLFQQLRDFAGRSPGYWDLIYTTGYAQPGNGDLVWMAVDWDKYQVVIGIPYCNIGVGYGQGLDTVVLKYHCQGGGFTRQQFPGVIYTAADYLRAQGNQAAVKVYGTPNVGEFTVQRYGYQRLANDISLPLPSALPTVTFGPYAPWGADGRGVVRRAYLVIALDFFALNIAAIANDAVGTVTTSGLHHVQTGMIVELFNVTGMTQVNGRQFVVTRIDSLSFSIGENTTAYGVFTAGRYARPTAFDCTLTVDGTIVAQSQVFTPTTFGLSLRCTAPPTPYYGDLWYDMSETDPNLGNNAAVPGTITPNFGGFLLRVRYDNKPVAITGATKANPCVITAPAHGFATNQRVSIRNVAGMTQLNNDADPGPYTKDYIIIVIDADHFSIGVNSLAFGTYTSGGFASLAWQLVPGGGARPVPSFGEGGGPFTRASIPIPVMRHEGTRVLLKMRTTILGYRYQLEGFGLNPGEGTSDA